ncbi:hypothetical protein F5B22DRAFT_601363 [Xylaria bambusicola]|uniref:uncharacterized protein n=1 Tax=Xylaria bambusicola TaxID=326684 RepID=UPI0020081598|nr:uncharacterized protein F5B22DRAFT_601363 [Xylaria bambusicola]KAI0518001.1 hypothetical protein F5B22DRAFT_601363 [Xylaria bambusicola]
MSETDPSTALERRPACDACKTRKTKCDRKSPCASCVTLNVPCRTTHRTGEKRQRVLLSGRYEDAVLDLSRQLADVKEMLQAHVLSKDTGLLASNSQTASSDASAYTPQSMIDEQLPVLTDVQEGYDGDTSFTSHAHQVKTALGATLTPFELETSLGIPLDNGNGKRSASPGHTSTDPRNAGLSKMPLPPNDVTLKLLRLIKTEEQRAFVDLPLFTEDEFIEMCRSIYFALEPISLWTWICVNVGLYNLFMGIDEANCESLGTTVEAMRAHATIPRSNAERALQSLRLCSEPSLESCRALAVLVNFYVKQGHSTIAWRLASGAARAALDLGLHRLTSSDRNKGNYAWKELTIFWHIYIWEKGLAMTCGKSPSIRHFDVTSDLYNVIVEPGKDGIRNVLYRAFVFMAVAMGDIEESLFSVVAQKSSQQVRLEHVRRLSARLTQILDDVKTVSPDDPSWSTLKSKNTGGLSTSLHIILHCQLAIVYRFLPAGFLGAHPLQCSTECVNEARVALSMLLKVGEEALALGHADRWTAFLNVILSLVPLGPFIVLAGHTIATSSGDDMLLLSRMTNVLASVAERSPLIRNVHGACESLRNIADRIVSSNGPAKYDNAHQGLPQDQDQEQFADTLPMGQQDWDTVMMGFESSQFGDYDSRTVTNIMEPSFVNTYW